MIEEKYINVVLKRCLGLDNIKPLFISYDKSILEFVKKVKKEAKKMGIKDIYLFEKDIYNELKIYESMSVSEIKKCEYFDYHKWDEYVKKDAAFLILDTEFPNMLDNIDSKKIAAASMARRNSKPLYRKKSLKCEIAWCIIAVPNEYWAKNLFPNTDKPLQEFWNIISEICQLNSDNPIDEWNKILKNRMNIIEKLNELNIKKLIYKNKLGTNLEIEMPDNVIWSSSSCGNWIVNFPSYEIFTSPNYRKVNGIVYNTKPLFYNGKIIDNFYLKFKSGKVVNFDAKKGKEDLKEIIESDKLASYLGEVALVNHNSPISKTNILFKTTLLDENASCHLALGSAFPECIQDGLKFSNQELDKKGINLSKNHVDFMIGSNDLEVVAETKNGQMTIMKNGNIVI